MACCCLVTSAQAKSQLLNSSRLIQVADAPLLMLDMMMGDGAMPVMHSDARHRDAKDHGGSAAHLELRGRSIKAGRSNKKAD